jgi:Hint domain
LNSVLSEFSVDLEHDLFGTVAQTSDLYIAIPQAGLPGQVGAVITTDGEMVICYLRGTNILTPTGERRIEALQPGDLVITHSSGARSIKWIGEQSFSGRSVTKNRDRLPVKIEAGALGEYLPLRDLYVSPGHSILIGTILVLARDLINGVTITQPDRAEDTHYHLMELDAHDCVIAEGVWAETFADGPGLRDQFHNAAAFYAHYPGHVAPDELQLYLPRPKFGPALEAALRPVLARAGVVAGALRGFVENINAGKIEGWAFDEANPEFPVLVAIFDGDNKLGEALACNYRDDLAAAGLGRGRCMFSFTPPTSLSDLADISVLRAADDAALSYTPACQRRAA